MSKRPGYARELVSHASRTDRCSGTLARVTAAWT